MTQIRPFCMPKWGIEMTEGVLAEWMVGEGDAVTRGQTICSIETAKITNEVDAEFDTVLRRLLMPAGGDAVPVGTLLGVFAAAETPDAEIDAFVAAFRPAETRVAAKAGPSEQPARKLETNRAISPQAFKLAELEGVELSEVVGSGRNGRITYQDIQQASRPLTAPVLRGSAPLAGEQPRIFASPLARRLAARHGIDLAGVQGTGARGRIAKADVLALVSDPATAPADPVVTAENHPEVVPFDRVRKVVARRLTEAKQQLPHFYLRLSVQADALLDLRRTANLVLGCKASLNDYLVKAAALALVRHPEVNVQVHGEALHRFPHADVAIAVASPKGLVTPVVRHADLLRIDQLAAETRRLIDKASAGKLSFADMDGGTFSVSNLGMFGIESFDAIINPPQAAILAVGAAQRHPVEAPGGTVAFETRIALTLSVDHRAIDGAAGAQFMATLKQLIEAPEALFA